MAKKLKVKMNKKDFLHQHRLMREKDRFYGTTTLGARGQVVIPAQARKDLKLEPGDQIAVMGKFGKVLGLMRTDQLSSFVEMVMKQVSGSGMEGEIKKYLESFIKQIK